MPHFLIQSKNVQNNKIAIDDKDLYKHIIKVLRAKIGEKLLFLDENEIQYETNLEEKEQIYFGKQTISQTMLPKQIKTYKFL